MTSARLYFDNAATSWPKPVEVYDAVDRYQRESGVAVGRGGHRRGMELQQTVDRCRLRAARLLGVSDPRRIVIGGNGTDALNLAIQGVLRPGDRVVTTVVEHNSVLRPLEELRVRRGIEVELVSTDDAGIVRVDELRAALSRPARLVVLSHVSNVTGAIQPVDDCIALAHAAGALVLIDAAQSAGHLPLNVAAQGIDLLACSGHKGLLGPLGTGLLAIAPGIEEQLAPLRFGGTGTQSEQPSQPCGLPEKYESGNLNAPGLVGLDAALGWRLDQDAQSLRSHEQELTAILLEGLARLPQVRAYGPCDPQRQTGVVSLTIDGFDPSEVATILDEEFGIECRSGLHCAPRMHERLGTASTGGTVRLSLGTFTTSDDIAALLAAIETLCAG
jgi:cysteine desulfurase/selenocysteine lyase